MKTRLQWALLLAPFLLLLACSGGKGGGNDNAVIHLQDDGDLAATVNGIQIPVVLVEAVARSQGDDPRNPQQYQQALDQTTRYVLLAQEAGKLKVKQQQDLAAMVEARRLQGLAGAVLLAYRRAHPIPDNMVAKDYALQVQEAGKLTYRFTQILFQDKADVEKAASELAKGTAFSTVYEEWKDKAVDARAYSGVFPRQLPGTLGEVLKQLEPGQTSDPVHSQLGWHLLHLDGTDAFQAPPLDQVSSTVRTRMQRKQATAWLQSLEDNAAIVISPASRTIPLQQDDLKPIEPIPAERSQIVVESAASAAPAEAATVGASQ